MKFRAAMLVLLIAAMAMGASAATIIDPFTGTNSANVVTIGNWQRTISQTHTGVQSPAINATTTGLELNSSNQVLSVQWTLNWAWMGGGLGADLSADNQFVLTVDSDKLADYSMMIGAQTIALGSFSGTHTVSVPFSAFTTITDWSAITGITVYANSTVGLAGTDFLFTNLHTEVPEPGTYALMAGGLLALAGLARRRKA